MFNKSAFREWRERHFGKGKIMADIPAKSLIVYDNPRCLICGYRDEAGQCEKGKKRPEKCSVPLRFEAQCPSCGIVKYGLRQWGECFIKFECQGTTRSGHRCGCRFSLSFHTGDSEDEKSKQRWLAADDGEDSSHWTDFTIRKF